MGEYALGTYKCSEHIIHNTMKSLNVLISRALEINEISVKYMKKNKKKQKNKKTYALTFVSII